jgi:hypothetical protein
MLYNRLRTTARLILTAAGLLAAAAGPAAAQQPLSLQIQGGAVTLHARNVTVRQILAEWARVGGTRIVNLERVAGGPVTLDLEQVPERQALDIILRNVAGYVLGQRQAPAASGSAIDRVLILASSNAPAARPSQPTFSNGPAGRVPRPGFPQPLPQPEFDPADPEENPPDDVEPGDLVEPRIVRPRPGMVQPPFGEGEVQPDPDDSDTGDGGVTIIGPSAPITAPAGSSSTPGVVTPVPDPEQNQRPRIQDPD